MTDYTKADLLARRAKALVMEIQRVHQGQAYCEACDGDVPALPPEYEVPSLAEIEPLYRLYR